MKTIKTILALSVLIISGTSIAQTSGTIKGSITDEKKEAVPYAAVAILQDSDIIFTTQADINGEFTIKDVIPGKYTVKALATGFTGKQKEGVSVNPNQIRYVDISLSMSATDLGTIVVSEKFIEPAFDPKFSTVTPISIDQIENSATGKTDIIAMITMLTPGVLPTNDGKDIYMRGSRRGSTTYYVDGNKTMGIPDVPGMGISGMEVLTGGVPAEYGDCTGGIVLITTKEYKWEMMRKQNELDDRKESKMGDRKIEEE